jgi:hypothetical protein
LKICVMTIEHWCSVKYEFKCFQITCRCKNYEEHVELHMKSHALVEYSPVSFSLYLFVRSADDVG